MGKEPLLLALQQEVSRYNQIVATTNGDWIIKGFIDIYQNVYMISIDTKVVSKILELLLIPELVRFARKHSLEIVLAAHQNFYPDVSLVDSAGSRFAIDLKTAYRNKTDQVTGMTLGAFTGYFRDRQSTKNITFPYGSYAAHFVLGVIYTRVDIDDNGEGRNYALSDLAMIPSVIKDFQFFVQEKYRIAADRPGSGNTKNIGSVTKIEALVSGNGHFAALGEAVFDDYWMYYLTADMARAAELAQPPYKNLGEYKKYKGLPV